MNFYVFILNLTCINAPYFIQLYWMWILCYVLDLFEVITTNQTRPISIQGNEVKIHFNSMGQAECSSYVCAVLFQVVRLHLTGHITGESAIFNCLILTRDHYLWSPNVDPRVLIVIVYCWRWLDMSTCVCLGLNPDHYL